MDNKSVGATQHLGERSTVQQPGSRSARAMTIILSERGLLGVTWVFDGGSDMAGAISFGHQKQWGRVVTGRNGG